MIPTLYEPFRHWSDGGSVYILSDLHFDDADCKLMDSGWITPEKQIAIINGMVMQNDTFVCLGDVGKADYLKLIKAKRKMIKEGVLSDIPSIHRATIDNATKRKQLKEESGG